MTLRIAFVASPLEGPSSQVQPIGAMAVGSYVKARFSAAVEVKIFNCGSQTAERRAASAAIAAFQPNIVGFPIYSGHIHEVIAWAETLRAMLPDALFVAGGPHVTLSGAHFLDRWGSVFRYAISGDGEQAMLALAEAAAAGDLAQCHDTPGLGRMVDGTAVFNPAAVLPVDDWVDPFACEVIDSGEPLEFTDRRDHRRRNAVALVSSRSCPQRCSFCAIVAMPGKWRSAPTDQILTWLVDRHARQPFEHIYFLDANFFVSARRVRELIGAIAASLPGVTWSTSSTVGYLLRMKDDMPWLIENGLRAIELGLESGSPEQLKFLNKIATVPQNLEAVQLVQKHGLELGLDFIMFYPDQTPDLLKENLIFLQEAQLLDEEAHDHYLTVLKLYPGTPLRRLYEDRLGQAFDPDELPQIEPLFVDDRMRSIHRLFFEDFVPRYLPAIIAAMKDRVAQAARLRTSDPRTAQTRRFEAMLLRHAPFKLLWRLCDQPFARTAADAWPWLAAFDGSAASIAKLASDSLEPVADIAA